MADSLSGCELRLFREGRDWDQSTLADHLNQRLGRHYDKARISRWETDRERIPQIVAREIRIDKPPEPIGVPVAVSRGPALVVTVSLQKGGVAKTTTSVNLAFLLARKGQRVLLVDCDPQGSATINVGEDPHALELARKTLTAILDLNSNLATKEAVTSVCNGSFDILASSISLSEIEISLMSDPTASLALREKLSEVSADYDFVVIDTPPNLGLLTASALGAADLVLIPSQTEQLSLMGIPLLLRAVDRTKRRINRRLKVLGILPTHYDSRTSLDRQMLDELTKIAKQQGISLYPPVGRTVGYKEAVSAGRPALDRTPNITGAESYEAIVKELIEMAQNRAVGKADVSQ